MLTNHIIFGEFDRSPSNPLRLYINDLYSALEFYEELLAIRKIIKNICNYSAWVKQYQ